MSTVRLAPRRRMPRVLVVLVSLALLAVGMKAGTMFWFSEAGARAYHDGRYDDSASSFARLDTFNVIDPSLAFVGIGDARYRHGDLVAAEVAFNRALDLAPDDCRVRFNLAVTIEAQGDVLVASGALDPDASDQPFDPAAPRRDDPLERYTIALAVAEAQPCPSSAPDDVGDRLATTRDRLERKLAALRDETGDNESPQPEAPENNERGDSEEIENLELRNQAGANQREQARDRDTTGVTPEGQSNW